MKREGISIIFIHGFPWALSYSLDHLLLFECVCGVSFESIFENVFVMVLVSIRTHTKCCFENSSKMCLWNVFLKVILKRCLLCSGSHFYKNAYKVLVFGKCFKMKVLV